MSYIKRDIFQAKSLGFKDASAQPQRRLYIIFSGYISPGKDLGCLRCSHLAAPVGKDLAFAIRSD